MSSLTSKYNKNNHSFLHYYGGMNSARHINLIYQYWRNIRLDNIAVTQSNM